MNEPTAIQKIEEKAKEKNKLIVLPEAAIDLRVLHAANLLSKNGAATPILIEKNGDVQKFARENDIKLETGIALVDLEKAVDIKSRIEFFRERLSHKNPTEKQLKDLANNKLMAAGWMVATGRADGAVAGSVASTADVIRAALRTVGIAEGAKLISSTFLMELLNGKVLTYADCGVVPYPDAHQLADIAISSGKTHQSLTGEEPVIGFLSFSTKGSAQHERVELVRNALEIAASAKPDWKIDGEFQFDALFEPKVAKRKAPESEVAGNANVYIFPNLDAGNIAYKITERVGGATAIGPILQGLKKPYMDLSRGCSTQDIYYAACIASVMG
ncbi:MAG: phosphate acetyltransferase [Balneolaceae bacterium]